MVRKCNNTSLEFRIGKQFTVTSTLNTYKMTHKVEKPHKCSECAKQFSHMGHFIKHKLTHTGEKPHKCSDCGKQFYQAAHLKTHMLTHTREKPHKCLDCGKEYARACGLRMHKLLSTHTSGHTGKPHRCTRCGKRFEDVYYLMSHLRIHHGENPYKCSKCIRTFETIPDLCRHMWTHNGGNPHNCSQCNMTFNQKQDLDQHMMTHTAETPYGCTVCSKRFTALHDFVNHMNTEDCDQPQSNFTDNTGIYLINNHHARNSPGVGNVENGEGIYYTQVSDNVDGLAAIIKQEIPSTSTLVHDSPTQIYQTLIQRHGHDSTQCDDQSEDKTGMAEILGIPIIVQPETTSFNDYQHVEEDLYSCSSRTFKVEEIPQDSFFGAQNDMIQDSTSYMDNIDYSSCTMCVRGFLRPIELEEHIETHLKEQITVQAEETMYFLSGGKVSY